MVDRVCVSKPSPYIRILIGVTKVSVAVIKLALSVFQEDFEVFFLWYIYEGLKGIKAYIYFTKNT